MEQPRIGIIGAGIAGLTAADWLSATSCEVTILEARKHPGGRIRTICPPFSSKPIELGAEFIHGDCNETWKMFRRCPDFQPDEFPDRHWEFRDGKLTENNKFWDDLGVVMGKFENVESDESFASFLRHVQKVPKRIRTLAKDYVEGFHAAEPEQVSVVALEESEESAEETNGQKQFRNLGGYNGLIDWLVDKLRRRNVEFYFGTTVTAVRWKKGQVKIETAPKSDLAPFHALIVTLPLGVLQAQPGEPGAVQFEPDLTKKRELWQKLRMGNVMKLTLVFRKPFWSKKIFGFIHAHDQTFPTWWTNKFSSILVGWTGGPKSDDLSNLSKEEIVSLALEELAKIFKTSKSEIEKTLLEGVLHDWRNDPFSRGAYSYLPVGTTQLPSQLAEPIDETLLFAGEAFAPSGEQGTVHGAIASGQAAARKILQAF